MVTNVSRKYSVALVNVEISTAISVEPALKVKAADSSDPLPVLTFMATPCRNPEDLSPYLQCLESLRSRITY
jgi:hypothetical protein